MSEVATLEMDIDGLGEKGIMPTVAVIGAGQMGSGIAQTSAQFGYDVLLHDIDVAIAEKAKEKIGGAAHSLGEQLGITDELAEKLTLAGGIAPEYIIGMSPVSNPSVLPGFMVMAGRPLFKGEAALRISLSRYWR